MHDSNNGKSTVDDTICRHIPLRYLLEGISGKYLSFTEIHKWQDGTECAIEDYKIVTQNSCGETRAGYFNIRDMVYGTCWSRGLKCAARWENESAQYEFLFDSNGKFVKDYEKIKALVNLPYLIPSQLKKLNDVDLIKKILDREVRIVTTTRQLSKILSVQNETNTTYAFCLGDVSYVERSTFSLLKKSCWEEAMRFNIINAHDKEIEHLTSSLRYKLEDYKYENEYRALIICNMALKCNPPNHCKIEGGYCQLPCDYNELVNAIVLHPKYKLILMPRCGLFHYKKETVENAFLIHRFIYLLIASAYRQSETIMPENIFQTSDAYHMSVSDSDPEWLSEKHIETIEQYLASSDEEVQL